MADVKIRGINQQKLIKALMDAATGETGMSATQLGAARALLDKVLPGAARTGDDAQAQINPQYVEFRLVSIGAGTAAADGDRTASTPATAADRAEP